MTNQTKFDTRYSMNDLIEYRIRGPRGRIFLMLPLDFTASTFSECNIRSFVPNDLNELNEFRCLVNSFGSLTNIGYQNSIVNIR